MWLVTRPEPQTQKREDKTSRRPYGKNAAEPSPSPQPTKQATEGPRHGTRKSLQPTSATLHQVRPQHRVGKATPEPSDPALPQPLSVATETADSL